MPAACLEATGGGGRKAGSMARLGFWRHFFLAPGAKLWEVLYSFYKTALAVLIHLPFHLSSFKRYMYKCIYFSFSTSGNPMTWLFLSNNSSYRFFQVSTDKIFLTRSLLNGCFLNVLFLYWVILISIILLHKYLHKCSSHAELLSLALPCGIWKGGFMAVYHSFLWWLLKRLFFKKNVVSPFHSFYCTE